VADTYYVGFRESTAGANKRHGAVFNASGSGKVLVVYRITAIPSPTAAVTGLIVPLVAVRLTSAPSGGSAGAFAKACPANITNGRNATPDPPAQVTAVFNHTGGSIEGGASAVAFGIGAVSGEETQASQESIIYEAPIDGSEQVMCPEGWGFEIRQLTLASAGAVSIQAVIGLVDPADTL
jgi:hypothetical protein